MHLQFPPSSLRKANKSDLDNDIMDGWAFDSILYINQDVIKWCANIASPVQPLLHSLPGLENLKGKDNNRRSGERRMVNPHSPPYFVSIPSSVPFQSRKSLEKQHKWRLASGRR